jgi:hypothetical protein
MSALKEWVQTHKRITIGIVIATLVIIGIVVAGFATDWFGLTGETKPSEPEPEPQPDPEPQPEPEPAPEEMKPPTCINELGCPCFLNADKLSYTVADPRMLNLPRDLVLQCIQKVNTPCACTA